MTDMDSRPHGAPTTAPGPGRGRPAAAPDLRGLPVLRDAAPETVARAAARATLRTYDTGALILDFNDESTDVFFVLDGAVRVQIRTPGGRELILTEVRAGDMFGEIAAIDNAPRTANVTAIMPARVCVMPAAAFLDAACSTPAACMALLRQVTAIVRRQSERVLEREALPVRMRLSAELLRLSRPRQGGDGAAEGDARIVSPPPPHHVLAARIGARREVVSRALAALEKQGLVAKTRGGLVLPSAAALRDAMQAEETEG
jgi:CRP-like cAMP-binding protein